MFRLGLYLFTRILKEGQDKRFDKAKESHAVFFTFWTLQGNNNNIYYINNINIISDLKALLTVLQILEDFGCLLLWAHFDSWRHNRRSVHLAFFPLHICATEYRQSVTTCAYANLSLINAHHITRVLFSCSLNLVCKHQCSIAIILSKVQNV